MTIVVKVGSEQVLVERKVFTGLLDNSVVSHRVPYTRALQTSRIDFSDLVELARKGEIPYVLFFAPWEVVEQQMKREMDLLLRGVGKASFAMASRGSVQLRDVGLIVKDLLRKQNLLKKHDLTLVQNTIVGSLKGSRRGVVDDASTLRTLLDFRVDDIKGTTNKTAAFELLVSRFERKQILVAQSQRTFMPQLIPPQVKFSGLCVKDKKIPYIFLAGGDDDENYEPQGRRVFTLALLGVCVARGRFLPVTYSDKTGEVIRTREYEIAEELLMPAAEVRDLSADSLEAIKANAEMYRVTPSAYLMRARRLRLVNAAVARGYLVQLRDEFRQREELTRRQPKAVNAFRKYNGVEFSRRLLAQMDAGKISATDACRVLFLNKLKPAQIPDFRAVLR